MKPILPFQWNKIGKDRLVLLLLFGLLLLVVVIPVNTIDETIGGQKKEGIIKENDNHQIQMIGENGEKDSYQTGGSVEGAYTENTQYAEVMEQKLEEVLSCMDGVGAAKAFVTVKNSSEKVVEKDNPNERKNVYETDSEGGTRNTMEYSNEITTVYTVDENGKQIPLIVRENAPQIEGVFIVAQGGANEKVKVHIIEAIEALFGIEPHKIKVVKMKSE